jgi:PAS domain S-box-containing protein
VRVVGVSDDTESVEELRERLRRLEAAVDATGIGLWEWDVPTGVLTWNARNRELLGVSHAEPLTIQDYPGLVHPDDLELVRIAYREAADKPDGGDLVFEYRTAPGADGKSRWLQQHGRVLKDGEGVRRVVGGTMDVTDRKSAEERRGLVLRELAHRSRNGILLLMSLVSQTARETTSVKELETVLIGRLQALADCQDLLTQAGGRSLLLGDLLDRALSPFDAARFGIGPGVREITVSASMVVALALLVHELATNAVKYGALSAPAGGVSLRLAPTVDGHAHLAWVETGGPAVPPPTRRGFGSRLLAISLRNDGGRVEARFDPAGFQADIHFPVGRG